eukprot:5928591-Amphidinium_carterae.2
MAQASGPSIHWVSRHNPKSILISCCNVGTRRALGLDPSRGRDTHLDKAEALDLEGCLVGPQDTLFLVVLARCDTTDLN